MPPNHERRNMHLARQISQTLPTPTAVAIGNFDGLHRGHQAVIRTMLEAAQAQHLVPSVLTFEPHPRRFFRPELPDFRIERLHDKFTRLREVGVAQLVVPKFNASLAQLSAEDFLHGVLGQGLRARVVVTGEDFAFGHQRRGDVALLRAWGEAHGVRILTVPAVKVDGAVCSSSAVRAAITEGDMAQAATLLGRNYSLRGRVIHGHHRGRTLGFPTANVALMPGLLLPAYGVYAVRSEHRGHPLRGVANLGKRPTIGEDDPASLEAHWFDFSGDLYGSNLAVSFVKMLRPERKFPDLAALKAQITEDCMAARAVLA